MTRKDNTTPATKADLADLRELLSKRFGEIDKRFDEIDKRFDETDKRFDGVDKRLDGIEKRLMTHDQQFDFLVKLLNSVQEDVETIKRDLRIVSEHVLQDLDRRILACERRLGLAV